MCQSYQSLNSEEVQETPGQGLNPFFFRLVIMDDKRLKKIKVHFNCEWLFATDGMSYSLNTNCIESQFHHCICFHQFLEFRRVKYETSSDEEVVSTGEKWCAAFRARKEQRG